MLREIRKKDKLNFFDFSEKNNLNFCLFDDFVNQKKIAFISEEKDIIEGLIFLEKKDDMYVNLITASKKTANNLLKILFWNYKKDLYAKIDESNKIGFVLKDNGFKIIGKKDKIFLLYYNPDKKGIKYNGKRDNRKYNHSN